MNHLLSRTFIILGLFLALCSAVPAQNAPSTKTRTYKVRQTVSLSDIPLDAKNIVWWVAVPEDDKYQRVLDLKVTRVPGTWSLVRDPDHGSRFMKIEVANPNSGTLESTIEFQVRRDPVHFNIRADGVTTLSEDQKIWFAGELERNAPHMEVTPDIQKMADKTCGSETNPAVQARLLLDLVAGTADHYSKDPTKPKCGVGSAGDCLANLGGCCSDLHALFVALARARGIPARFQMGYRVLEKNDNKEVDPGYRCWVEYFLNGYGWVPADIVEADAEGGLGPAVWFNGLTERRVWLNAGRNFDLAGRRHKDRINLMVIGHAEIDGVPARVLPEGDKEAQINRRVWFSELKTAAATE